MSEYQDNGILVLDGRFRVFRDGSINQIVEGIESPARVYGANNQKAYLIVPYKDDEGKKKSTVVHRLVAKAFIPNPHNYPCVNHIDGNKHNNSVENLEWVTHSMNTRHAFKNGLINFHRDGKVCKFCGRPIADRSESSYCYRCDRMAWRQYIMEKFLADCENFNDFSDIEKLIIQHWSSGETYQQTGASLGLSAGFVKGTVRRVHEKIRAHRGL